MDMLPWATAALFVMCLASFSQTARDAVDRFVAEASSAAFGAAASTRQHVCKAGVIVFAGSVFYGLFTFYGALACRGVKPTVDGSESSCPGTGHLVIATLLCSLVSLAASKLLLRTMSIWQKLVSGRQRSTPLSFYWRNVYPYEQLSMNSKKTQ